LTFLIILGFGFGSSVKDEFKVIALKKHANQVTNGNVLGIVAEAMVNGIKSQNIISGFQSCGIWPLEPDRLLESVGFDWSTVAEELADEAAELKSLPQPLDDAASSRLAAVSVVGGEWCSCACGRA
jgi:hypothetical protein